MADVRSMLRAERANRRITHPNAAYTSDGKLSCKLCETTVKSEAGWSAHLHSSQHSLRLHRAQEAAAAQAGTTATSTQSRKRKASMLGSPAADDKKRVRSAESVPLSAKSHAHVTTSSTEGDPITPIKPMHVRVDVEAADQETPAPPTAAFNDAENAEFEAFEREIAAIDEISQKPLALRTEATISAAPISAEDLAARNEAEGNGSRSRRDAEIEAEQEDAARLLEEEFEEMESLEERVRRLREKREALRRETKLKPDLGSGLPPIRHDTLAHNSAIAEHVDGEINNGNNDKGDDNDEEDDDDDEFDDWRFGGT